MRCTFAKKNFEGNLLMAPLPRLLWPDAFVLLSGPVPMHRGADGSKSAEYNTGADVKSFLPK